MHFNCKTYDPAQIASIAKEYVSGVAMCRLAKKHHIAADTLERLFSEIGVEHRGIKAAINASAEHADANITRRKLSASERIVFCERYGTVCISVADLAGEFGISKGVARKILNQENLFREPAYLSYALDAEFFTDINTPEKAYWFGFIMADGCVFGMPSPGLRIGLKSSDSGHLEAFKADIGSSHPVKFSMKKYMWHGEERSAGACAVDIRNRTLFDSLVSHGCVPNKTNNCTDITGIPEHLFRHFARGYFDGDGCITFTARSNRVTKAGMFYVDPSWSCVGNLSTMAYLLDGIQAATGLVLAGLKQRRGCWFMSVSGVHKVSSLFDFFYCEAGPFLPRKKIKWEEGNQRIALNSN